MGTVLLVVLLLALLGTVPTQTGKRWGYGPPGVAALLLVLVLVLIFAGRIPWTGWEWGPRS